MASVEPKRSMDCNCNGANANERRKSDLLPSFPLPVLCTGFSVPSPCSNDMRLRCWGENGREKHTGSATVAAVVPVPDEFELNESVDEVDDEWGEHSFVGEEGE